MRAHGIRSYHRPGRLEDALALAAQGAVPVGGGTRIFAAPGAVPTLLDLQALNLSTISSEDGDLHLGASVTLQDAIDAEAAWAGTAGLLPAACQAQSPSRMVRGMATLAGESVYGAETSEVAAALLALNAVFVIAHPEEPRESPALRFLRQPKDDLEGGGLVERIFIPGAPDGAALERASLLPSAPALVAVAVTVAFSGDKCSRARIALAGLAGRPARFLDAEAQVERTSADEEALARAAEQAALLAPVRTDGGIGADYKRHLVRVLTLRALRRALQQAREGQRAERKALRPRPTAAGSEPAPLFHLGPARDERERTPAAGRGRRAHHPGGALATSGTARSQGCLRHRPVRGLHGAPRRATRERMRDPRGESPRAKRADGRGPFAPLGLLHPRGLCRSRRHALRLLHSRHGAEREGPRGARGQSDRGRSARRARGVPLPVHGVRAPPGRGTCGGLEKGPVLIQDRLKLATGRAAFADDLEMPGTLTACVLRSPHPHARLVSMDASGARALPGTVAVLAALDLDVPPFLDPVARFAGAPWAAVAAEDRELAEHAAAVLSYVATPEAPTFDPEGTVTEAITAAREGDVDAAFRGGVRVASAMYRWPFVHAQALEPPTSLAWLDEDGRLVVRATTHTPFALRTRLARDLGLPSSGLRVVRPQVGVPFGSALEPREASLCAALSLRTGRPVRLVEATATSPTAPREAAHRVEIRTAWRGARLVAVDASLLLNLGAEKEGVELVLAGAMDMLRSARLDSYRVRARAGFTHLPPLADPRRTAARLLRFALAGAAREAAQSRGEDALGFHLASARPELQAALQAGASALGWDSAAPASGGRAPLRGRGVALAGPWSAAGVSATAGLTLNEDGSFALRLGAGGVSAGLGQAFVEKAAAILGAPPDRFSIVAADTDSAPAEDAEQPEPQITARAVERAAAELRERAAPGSRRKKAGSADATAALEGSDVPSVVAAVFAEVELDADTGLARTRKLVLAPVGATATPLGAWEDGQIAAALPLVFGGPAPATAMDVPVIARAGEPPEGDALAIPPLADLVPAAAAALAQAISEAAGVPVRELPVRPETLLGSSGQSSR